MTFPAKAEGYDRIPGLKYRQQCFRDTICSDERYMLLLNMPALSGNSAEQECEF